MKIDGYKFGNKNNWRRWVWNRICEKYKRSKKDSIIVYLAGTEDLDRKIAIEKGFKSHNMIAIDRNEEVVKTLREKGVIAIHGDLFEVLKGFSGTSCKIDILIADVCCGVTDSVYEFAKHMTAEVYAPIFDPGHSPDDGTAVDDFDCPVIMFNFMRGRDKGIILNSFTGKSKHRGEMLIEAMCKIRAEKQEKDFKRIAAEQHRDLNDTELQIIDEEMENSLGCYDPEYKSYKSSNIVMDSVVFNYLSPGVLWCGTVPNECTRKVTAALAIRTMKINGQLKPCPIA